MLIGDTQQETSNELAIKGITQSIALNWLQIHEMIQSHPAFPGLDDVERATLISQIEAAAINAHLAAGLECPKFDRTTHSTSSDEKSLVE